MKLRTLRARVALWAAAVLSGALVLFGAGAAWNLQRELIANLDEEIQNDARDFLDELREQPPDWSNRRRVAASAADETGRFQFIEVRDKAGGLLYRSSSLGDQPVIRPAGDRNYSVTANGRGVRFGVFENQGATFALGKDLREVNEMLTVLISAYLLTLPLVVIAGGVGAWWIARRAAAPVQAIAESAANISASDLHQRITEPPSHDEIAHLTTVLNAMFERLQRSFEQVTRFTSDASHELKTPLALMRAQLENALGSSRNTPEQRELLSSMVGQCSEISQIIDGLLFLSRADDRQLALEHEPVDLVALVEDLREDAEILANEADLTLQFQLPAHLVVSGDMRLLRRAVMNMIDNAIKHNRTGGSVVVAASIEGRSNLLTFRNTGPGIPLAAREKIFERFYRGNPARSSETGGHGLGLSITREIARAHRGEVSLRRSDTDWTEFWLLLPLPAGSSSSPPNLSRDGITHSARKPEA